MPVILLVAAVVLGGAASAAAADAWSPGPRTVLPLQVSGAGGTVEGTCFLVHQEARDAHVVLYFLTAGHLLDPARVGEQHTASLRIRVQAEGTSVFETTGRGAVFPAGIEQDLDLAVFSIVTSTAGLMPIPVTAAVPEAGQMFVVQGYRTGELSALTEHVRFRSTRVVIGDRTAAEVHGFIGAPAMTDAAAFGVVTECSSGRVPVVTILSAASAFLSRALPGWPGFSRP
jgi:hypothetical protein